MTAPIGEHLLPAFTVMPVVPMVVVLAAWLPARRAGRADPIAWLEAE